MSDEPKLASDLRALIAAGKHSTRPQPTASADAEPVAWLYRQMTTAEADHVEFTRTPWFNTPSSWTETPLYTEAQMQARADAARREALEPVRRWRDNLKITQGSPIVGDDLHGPALDFVIECLDGLLKENPNAG